MKIVGPVLFFFFSVESGVILVLHPTGIAPTSLIFIGPVVS